MQKSEFDVKLSDKPLTIVQPDIMVICDKNKLDGKRCNGAPDFIIEIVSPSNASDDYIRKLYYYKNYGVREYWIVDPQRKSVTINYFEGNLFNVPYTFDSVIKVNICEDLYINFSDISKLLHIQPKKGLSVNTDFYTLNLKIRIAHRNQCF